FDGLDHHRRVGPAANDRETRLNAPSGFAEAQLPLSPLFEFSLGLRADRFTDGCRLLGPDTSADPCVELEEVSQLSPKLGARSQLTEWAQVRASWSRGFALPNNFVKYAVGGQALEANVFRQTEIGVELTPLQGLTLDAAAFRLTSAQEVR